MFFHPNKLHACGGMDKHVVVTFVRTTTTSPHLCNLCVGTSGRLPPIWSVDASTGFQTRIQIISSSPPTHPPCWCVTVRTLCLLVSSVSVILSVARVVIHDMLHLMVHQGCDPFQIVPQFHKMVMMSVPHLDMVAEQ